MKVLLFTHSQDIDGMGCAVLARQAFLDVTIVPTKTFEITSNVKAYIDDKKIEDYDRVFVTDLCIKEPVLKEIDENESLKSKIMVLDHHKTEIEEGNDSYDFVNIIVSKNGRKESGTSLFYGYLLEQHYLEPKPILDELAEWTRQYDVWDWKKEDNIKARYLHILFELLGHEKYVELMDQKIKNFEHLEFDFEDMKLIDGFLKSVREEILECLSKMKIVTLTIDHKEYKVGYLRCPYKYRNDVNEIAREQGFDIDMVGMIVEEVDSVSYRQVNDVDVSIVATYFGGKGHFSAGSNPLGNEKFQELLRDENL